MKKSHPIFKAAVIVKNPQECDIARKICEEHELPMWEDVELAFRFVEYDDDETYLKYQDDSDDNQIGFFVDNIPEDDIEDYNVMSMKEFEELAIDYSLIGLSLEQLKQKFQETLRS